MITARCHHFLLPSFIFLFLPPLLYHFHSISCFLFSFSPKLNYICISLSKLPVFHPVSYIEVTCLILHPPSEPFISFGVCLCCWRHPESFSHHFILLSSDLYSNLIFLSFFSPLRVLQSFFCVCCIVFIPHK
jgi:hypothetical protein